MISLFETNKYVEELNVYLLGDYVSDENKQTLDSIAERYNRKFYAIDVPALDIPDILCSQRWPRSAYTRLFSGQLLPKDIEKALYLDCDTIITGDISCLAYKDISEHAIYGVKDCIGKYYKQNIGLGEKSPYINAGVLLLNLNKLRQMDMSKEIAKFLDMYAKTMIYADQDVLNGVFKGNVGELDPQYNLMTLLYVYTYNEVRMIRHPTNYYDKTTVENAKACPSIVHFTTCMLNIRPWFKNSEHPYAKEFEKYWAMSPWLNKSKEEMHFNSMETKILRIVFLFPNKIALFFLGLMHSVLRPLFLRLQVKSK